MTELIQQAGMALSSGNFTEAMHLFDQVREAEPENVESGASHHQSKIVELSLIEP